MNRAEAVEWALSFGYVRTTGNEYLKEHKPTGKAYKAVIGKRTMTIYHRVAAGREFDFVRKISYMDSYIRKDGMLARLVA